MQLSSLEEYGCRCAIQLARSFNKGPVSAADLAAKEGLTPEYVRRILFSLRKSGLIKTVRGKYGGYALAANPADTTLKQLFDGLNQTVLHGDENLCRKFAVNPKECVHGSECSIRPVWRKLSVVINEVLEKTTLQDLIKSEQEVRAKLI
ncbi:MAG: Rrf2 family transcriptional regulator [Bdellovibrionales bacterium]|mgnify:FL=1|nr:Rrf2 family transcriptional regulator [Bdellovibrionales bacterium]MBT3526872.1 Rrf2 family transcriptional regulator [Bdellovibrionales bacterium]MBT7765791.1 Rrf2 family transcriptional regulator [Bdellovibrionales bacterium]